MRFGWNTKKQECVRLPPVETTQNQITLNTSLVESILPQKNDDTRNVISNENQRNLMPAQHQHTINKPQTQYSDNQKLDRRNKSNTKSSDSHQLEPTKKNARNDAQSRSTNLYSSRAKEGTNGSQTAARKKKQKETRSRSPRSNYRKKSRSRSPRHSSQRKQSSSRSSPPRKDLSKDFSIKSSPVDRARSPTRKSPVRRPYARENSPRSVSAREREKYRRKSRSKSRELPYKKEEVLKQIQKDKSQHGDYKSIKNYIAGIWSDEETDHTKSRDQHMRTSSTSKREEESNTKYTKKGNTPVRKRSFSDQIKEHREKKIQRMEAQTFIEATPQPYRRFGLLPPIAPRIYASTRVPLYNPKQILSLPLLQV